MVVEQTHRYPRWIVWLFEFLSALAIGVAMVQLARDLLMLIWNSFGIDTSLLGRIPYLPELVLFLEQRRAGRTPPTGAGPTGAAAWPAQTTAGARLAAAGAAARPVAAQQPADHSHQPARDAGRVWRRLAAIPWETLRAIKVTEDPHGRALRVAGRDRPAAADWLAPHL